MDQQQQQTEPNVTCKRCGQKPASEAGMTVEAQVNVRGGVATLSGTVRCPDLCPACVQAVTPGVLTGAASEFFRYNEQEALSAARGEAGDQQSSQGE